MRERTPILSILTNNFSTAIELKVMPVATEKYRSTDISGNYADFARALGGYGERVSEPEQIVPAIRRGIEKTREGTARTPRVHHRKGGRRLALRVGEASPSSTQPAPGSPLPHCVGIVGEGPRLEAHVTTPMKRSCTSR